MPRDASPPQTGWRANLSLAFENRSGRTVLAKRTHDGPLVVQKAFHCEDDDACHAIVVHPPGGIAGGDELNVVVRTEEGARAVLTTPGAGKWYRSSGAWARQRVSLEVAPGAVIEWLPQENIVYDGALAELSWEADLAGDARLVSWDIACLGRTGSGERFTRGALRIHSRLRRNGRLAWLERGHIGASSLLTSPAGLDGRPVVGTLVVSAPSIDPEWTAVARACLPTQGEAAVTALPHVLLARYRGDSSEAARAHFTAIWEALRKPVLGREAIRPRIWST